MKKKKKKREIKACNEMECGILVCQSCKTANRSLTCCPSCVPNPSYSHEEVDRQIKEAQVEILRKVLPKYRKPDEYTEDNNFYNIEVSKNIAINNCRQYILDKAKEFGISEEEMIKE